MQMMVILVTPVLIASLHGIILDCVISARVVLSFILSDQNLLSKVARTFFKNVQWQALRLRCLDD